MCKRNSQDNNKEKIKKKKKSRHGMCKRNSPDKSDGRTGCVREIPHMNTKSAMDA